MSQAAVSLRRPSYLALLAAPLAAFGAVFCVPMIQLMYGDEYAPAAPVFAVCLFACSVSTVSQGGSSLLVSADRQATILVLVLGCALLKVLLDALLIRNWGLTGAMYAYVTVALFNAILIVALAMRTIGSHPNWNRLLRICIAAAIPALAVMPLRGQLLPWAQVLFGGLHRCRAVRFPDDAARLSGAAEDIEHLAQLYQRFVPAGDRAWSHGCWNGPTARR